jgi:NADH dehydrogenase
VDVVTGAFSYTGKQIARLLLERGHRVRTLTNHPNRPNPFGDQVQPLPYAFDDPKALRRTLDGAHRLYNTYWVRFERSGVTFQRAVENSRRLFEAARQAGVERIVHVSVTKPTFDSPLPYFRGKAQVEEVLRGVGVSHAVVRPTVVFGPGDILVNNIAWLLRRFPVFAIPGSGRYRVRPVHVDDVAHACLEAAESGEDVVVDAVGPEVMAFEEMVVAIRNAVGSRARLIHVPPGAVSLLTRGLGLLIGDVLLTRDELAGLMAELVHSEEHSTGEIRFTSWVAEQGQQLGARYASELDRHFRPAAR